MITQSSNKSDWQKNVKEVFRVTLIGIDPSDQVLVKGYLRLLLRVDFDLEWVQPKHPKVNMFVVNKQFESVDSVKNLLTASKAPVIYTTRVAGKSDVIEGNTLYLSLKNVSVLEDWLNQNVTMIYETFHADKAEKETKKVSEQSIKVSSNINKAQGSSQLKTVINDKALDGLKNKTNELPQNGVSNTTQKTHELTHDVVDLINRLNNIQSDAYFQITNGKEVIAIVKPKQRVVWPKGDSFFPDYELKWQIQEINPQNLQIKHAMNLNTWMWQCAQHKKSNVSAILPVSAKLSLKSWPKPKNNKEKSDYLRIFALTELKALSVEDIVAKTGIAQDKVHRCMAALYLAGFMDTGMITLDVFVKQQLRLNGAKKSITEPNQPITINNTPKNTKVTNKPQPKVIASGAEVAQMVSASVEQKNNDNYIEENAGLVKQKGFSGLLSRIRSSLGL